MAPRIFLGAARVFARLGYEAARVEDILAASGVSRRTYYKLFRSKESLFDALFKYGAEAVDSAVVSAIAEAGPDRTQRVEAAVRALFRMLDQFGPVSAAMLVEAWRPESRFAPLRERVFARFEELLMAEAAQTGVIPDRILVRALIAATENTAVLLFSHNTQRLDVERATAIVLRLITASLFAEGASVSALPIDSESSPSSSDTSRR